MESRSAVEQGLADVRRSRADMTGEAVVVSGSQGMYRNARPPRRARWRRLPRRGARVDSDLHRSRRHLAVSADRGDAHRSLAALFVRSPGGAVNLDRPHDDLYLVDLLDRLLAGGVVLSGEVTISLAGVDLV